MPRICTYTGRRTHSGNTYTHRGKAKYLGGVGTKITGKTKRTFRANIQTVTALVDGSVQRIKVSTKAIKMGLVTKPLRRKYAYRPDDQQPPAASGPRALVVDAAPTGADAPNAAESVEDHNSG